MGEWYDTQSNTVVTSRPEEGVQIVAGSSPTSDEQARLDAYNSAGTGGSPKAVEVTGAPSDGDSLVWNASAGQWEPGAGSGGSVTGRLNLSLPGNGTNRAFLSAAVTESESTLGFGIKDRITVADSTVVTLPPTLIHNSGAVDLFLDWAQLTFGADTYGASEEYGLSFSQPSQTIVAGGNFAQTDLAEDAPASGWVWDAATRHLTVPPGTWVAYLEADVKPVVP